MNRFVLVLVLLLAATPAWAGACQVPGCDVDEHHTHRLEMAELERDGEGDTPVVHVTSRGATEVVASTSTVRSPLGARKMVATREQAITRARYLVDWLAGSNVSPCHWRVTREDYASALGFFSPAEAARTLKDHTPGKGWRFDHVVRAIPREDAVMAFLDEGHEWGWGSYRGIPVGTWMLVNAEAETLGVDLNCLNITKLRRPKPMTAPLAKMREKTRVIVITHYHYLPAPQAPRPQMHQCRSGRCDQGYVPRQGPIMARRPPPPRRPPQRQRPQPRMPGFRPRPQPPRVFPPQMPPPVARVPGGYQYMDNRSFVDNRGAGARIQAGAGTPGMGHNHPPFPPQRAPQRPQPPMNVGPRHGVAAPGTGQRPSYTGPGRGQPGNLDYRPRQQGGGGGGGPTHR